MLHIAKMMLNSESACPKNIQIPVLGLLERISAKKIGYGCRRKLHKCHGAYRHSARQTNGYLHPNSVIKPKERVYKFIKRNHIFARNHIVLTVNPLQFQNFSPLSIKIFSSKPYTVPVYCLLYCLRPLVLECWPRYAADWTPTLQAYSIGILET